MVRVEADVPLDQDTVASHPREDDHSPRAAGWDPDHFTLNPVD